MKCKGGEREGRERERVGEGKLCVWGVAVVGEVVGVRGL